MYIVCIPYFILLLSTQLIHLNDMKIVYKERRQGHSTSSGHFSLHSIIRILAVIKKNFVPGPVNCSIASTGHRNSKRRLK